LHEYAKKPQVQQAASSLLHLAQKFRSCTGSTTGQQRLLFPPQKSTKIRDVSEKNSTAKSNRTKGSQSKKEGEERVLS
jgi:hypothetical protein